MPVFTKEEIRNYLVNRSFLHKKAKSLEEFFDKFICIQVDPIVYVAKSHEISLWNRVENYNSSLLEHDLYTSHSLIEYWMQLYSIFPAKFRKYTSAVMKSSPVWQQSFLNSHQEELEMARSYIRSAGPTTAGDLKHIPRTKTLFEWKGTTSNKAVLDYLWDKGEITIHHRQKNKKYYDFSERVLLEQNLELAEDQESCTFLVKAAFAYHGLVVRTMLWKSGRSIKDRLYKTFDEMLQTGEIKQVTIEGVKTRYYVLAQEIEQIHESGKKSLHTGLNFLPPFDPLIISRKTVSDIFDYDYQFQFYWPAGKRTFNPYGMPILYKGNIVGEVGLAKEREHRRLYLTELESTISSPEFKTLVEQEVVKLENMVFG